MKLTVPGLKGFKPNYKVVSFVLLLVVVGMLAAWRPWSAGADANARTVEVTGDSTQVSAADKFEFYPSYQFTNTDQDAALKALSAKSDAVVAELKKLGVPGNKIKTTANGHTTYEYGSSKPSDASYSMPVAPDGQDNTYLLQIVVTADSLELAQKVQDYLITTKPSGSITPVASFSDARRKQLEDAARSEAAKDARKKAEQMAKDLGFRLGKVKSVKDGSGFGSIPYLEARDTQADVQTSGGLEVNPGEYTLPYQVTVTYYVR